MCHCWISMTCARGSFSLTLLYSHAGKRHKDYSPSTIPPFQGFYGEKFPHFKCSIRVLENYVYKQFIAIKIVHTLNDIILHFALWLISYSNKLHDFLFNFNPPPLSLPPISPSTIPVLDGSKTHHFPQNFVCACEIHGFQSELPGTCVCVR